MKRLDGKVAIVTGGASGIGKGIVELFSCEGARVALLDVNQAAAEALVAECSGRDVAAFCCDISEEQQVKTAFAAAVDTWGAPDILLNNAGIEINGTAVDLTVEQWERQMAVNLRGTFLCSREAVARMRGRGGAIVNISSVHAFASYPACPAYDVSKAGLLGLTRAMALDHGKDRVRVNCICPGYIQTPLLEQWFAMMPDREAEVARVVQGHPVGRLGTPRDIAEACLFLCSEAASFITGATLVVDGGMTIAGH